MFDGNALRSLATDHCPLLHPGALEILSSGRLLRARLAQVLSGDKVPPGTLAALEMLHTATLFHDDVLDHDQERRGLPSLQGAEGSSLAVLSGDLLFTTALRLAAEEGGPPLLQAFLDSAHDTCCGEIRSQRLSAQAPPSPEQYLEIVTLKTGSLFGLAAWCAVRFSGRSEGEAIRELFTTAGALYQLHDDMRDIDLSDRSNSYVTFPLVLLAQYHPLQDFLTLSAAKQASILRQHAVPDIAAAFIRRHYGPLRLKIPGLHLDPRIEELLDEFLPYA